MNSLQSDQIPFPPFPGKSERASLGAACKHTNVVAKTHRVKQHFIVNTSRLRLYAADLLSDFIRVSTNQIAVFFTNTGNDIPVFIV